MPNVETTLLSAQGSCQVLGVAGAGTAAVGREPVDTQEERSKACGATVTKFGAGCPVIQAQVRAAKMPPAIDRPARRTQDGPRGDEGSGFCAGGGVVRFVGLFMFWKVTNIIWTTVVSGMLLAIPIVQASEFSKEIESARVSCLARSEARLAELNTFIQEAKKAGDANEVTRLSENHEKMSARGKTSCANIAAANAQTEINRRDIAAANAALSELREIGVLREKIKDALDYVRSHSNDGDLEKLKASVVILKMTDQYVARARKIFTDAPSRPLLDQLEVKNKEVLSLIDKSIRK